MERIEHDSSSIETTFESNIRKISRFTKIHDISPQATNSLNAKLQ